ncbi:helix-turn-helix domain-containing protein [Pacificoceanicola onchidii]|uniref:helix-turn-helix domain-containing protein n=1 Tax=Pacificoceanicola onchidii TaxID=2562685 RepID=UPI0014560154|nr:helix-turn-helix domain-containing protein [Pacificoceanicola onchidii]
MQDTPNPSSTKTIRALDRGLLLVETLSQRGQMTLAELRRSTGLSNPTLLRILLTLQERGWVRRNIAEGRYELAHSLGNLLGETARAHPLAEIAAPYLLELKSRQAGWPSDLCTMLGAGRIEIIESTRIRGPLAMTRTALGIRPSMVLSAHGRAILSFSSKEQRQIHLDGMKKAANKEDQRWIESGKLDAVIAQTRAQGFGLREPNYWQPPFDPGPEHAAMAVPVLSKTGVHGSISLIWMADEMSLDEVLALGSLQDLQKSSARIGVALDRAGIAAPRVA